MIRDLIKHQFNQRLSSLGEGYYADQWKNPEFEILFDHLELKIPGNGQDENWTIKYQVEGKIQARIHTDLQNPIDPTQLMLLCTQTPLLINPDPNEIQPSEMCFQGKITLNKSQDLLYQQGLITELTGNIENGYILERR